MVDIPGRSVDQAVAAWHMRHADTTPAKKFSGFVIIGQAEQPKAERTRPTVRIVRLGTDNPPLHTPTESSKAKHPPAPPEETTQDSSSLSEEFFPVIAATKDDTQESGLQTNTSNQRKKVTGRKALAAASALTLGTLATAACSSGDGNTTSYNYAGYGVKDIGTVTGVSEEFTVPDLNCEESGGNAVVSLWTGIGGNNKGTLQQIGILEGCETSTGGPTIVAFDEMYPQSAEMDDIGKISPGDKMQIGVMSLGGNKFDLFVRDTTKGRGKDIPKSCGESTCDQTQGLWIAEKQTEHSGPEALALPYWTAPIVVNSAAVQVRNGGYTPLSEISPKKLITYQMVDDSGPLAGITPLKPDSGAFTILRFAPPRPRTPTNS